MARFQYLNVNPNQQKRNDCVTRAIKLASGLEYAEVRRKLYHTGRLLGCNRLCWKCYNFLLTNVFGYRLVNCDDMTVADFANANKKGKYLIRIDYHLTFLQDGTIYDIWNCLDRNCVLAWRVD